MEDINSVCLLEWRKFDWNVIKEDIHSPKAYAWKIFILAVNRFYFSKFYLFF